MTVKSNDVPAVDRYQRSGYGLYMKKSYGRETSELIIYVVSVTTVPPPEKHYCLFLMAVTESVLTHVISLVILKGDDIAQM